MNTDRTALAIGLLTLQIAAFAWRITREVGMEAQRERTWFPLSDWLNLISFLTVTFCIVVALGTGVFGRGQTATLGVGFVLMAFYPIAQAGHYGLLLGRQREEPFPWMTCQEAVVSVISLCVAAIAGGALWFTVK